MDRGAWHAAVHGGTSETPTDASWSSPPAATKRPRASGVGRGALRHLNMAAGDSM